MTAIYLLRHGEPDYEPVRERHWPGSMAELAALSPEGVRQARMAAERLADVGVTRVITSPYTRALHTASVLAGRLGLLAEVEIDLHEWIPDDTFGWQDLAEVRGLVADFERCGGEWPPGQRRPWEPLSFVRRRAGNALRLAVSEMNPADALLAVSHEMVIRALTGLAQTGKGEFRLIDSSELP